MPDSPEHTTTLVVLDIVVSICQKIDGKHELLFFCGLRRIIIGDGVELFFLRHGRTHAPIELQVPTARHTDVRYNDVITAYTSEIQDVIQDRPRNSKRI